MNKSNALTTHVLVTGAGGYVGGLLVPMLLDRGCRVTAIDRFYFGTEVLQDPGDGVPLTIVNEDIRSVEERHFDGVDAVVHLAALSNDPACEIDRRWTIDVNHEATVRLAKMARVCGVSRFVFASSCSVYGASDDGMLVENSPLEPVSLYARAKLMTEEELFKLSGNGLGVTCLRMATLFGWAPRMRFDLVVNVMTLHAATTGLVQVFGGGQQWRPFLHVRDAAQAYIRCIEVPFEALEGTSFNLVAENLRIGDVAQRIQERIDGVRVELGGQDVDTRNYRVSGSLFHRTVGFEPQWSVVGGIDEMNARIRQGSVADPNDPKYYTTRRLKEVLERPAVDGGEPVSTRFLPFALPLIGEAEEREVIDTLRSGWITTGPKTRRFEEMCREYLGCNHAVALNSCTGALHLALVAMGFGEGDAILTSPVTWPATANVILHVGAKVVFVDVERDTLNIDIGKLRSRVEELMFDHEHSGGPRPRAVIPVHMAGQPCDMDALRELASEYGLRIIEDAAHAIGAEYGGKRIGSVGDVAAFSFYPIKNMTTIEGGLLATNDAELANKARILSLHGISKDAWKRYSSIGAIHWRLLMPGFKYNMTDVQASLGIHQLSKLDDFIATRKRYAERYDEAFENLAEIKPLARRSNIKHAHHLYIVLLDLERLSVTRDDFIAALKAENIGTGVHFISLHLQPYYEESHGLAPDDFPVARWISERIVSLPLYPKMEEDDVEAVIAAVRKVVKAYSVRGAGHSCEELHAAGNMMTTTGAGSGSPDRGLTG